MVTQGYEAHARDEKKEKNRPNPRKPQICIRIHLGRVIMDEAHKQQGPKNQVHESLYNVRCPIWYLTGTPCNCGPTHMIGWMKSLETDQWAFHGNARDFCEE